MQQGGARCVIERACLLRGAFERAESAFYRELDAVTLADLTGNAPQLVRHLGRAAGAR